MLCHSLLLLSILILHRLLLFLGWLPLLFASLLARTLNFGRIQLKKVFEIFLLLGFDWLGYLFPDGAAS